MEPELFNLKYALLCLIELDIQSYLIQAEDTLHDVIRKSEAHRLCKITLETLIGERSRKL